MSKEEKMLILQMVAEGKITPEQGAELLRALGDSRPESSSRPPVAPPPHYADVRQPDAPAGDFGSALEQNIRRTIETTVEASVQRAQAAAEAAAKRAEEFAQRFAEQGENLGKVLGESGENLGKIFARIFGGGWVFGGGNQYDFPEEIRGELPPEGEITVDMGTLNGRISLDVWDEPGYRLVVTRRVPAATEEEARSKANDLYEFTQDGLTLRARGREHRNNLFGSSPSVHFALTLPRDRRARIVVSSANGRLTFEGVKGSSLKASTANGRIEARGLDFSDISLDSANGRIEFTGKVRDLSLRTANGRVVADVEGAGNWNLSSANGRIELNVRKIPGAAYEVEASSVSGKVDVAGLEDAEVLINEVRHSGGARRYKARSRNYDAAEVRGSIKAHTASGRVIVVF
ncbi:MAG TPA: DUF4097 domain-containing protein [Firmicutes bacterium]|nr:DUF4097 domain-containing protein [Candidatus Fermentithermobacillaceae bacterium]